MCGLNFQVGCQNKLQVNSDSDNALANGLAEVSKELAHNHFILIFICSDITSENKKHQEFYQVYAVIFERTFSDTLAIVDLSSVEG